MIKRGMIGAAAVAVLLSGCGVFGSVDEKASDEGAADNGPSSSGAPSGEGASDSELGSSPIAEFLGLDAFDDLESEDGQARLIESQRQIYEAVAVCMADEGFEYIPINPAETISFASGIDDELDYGSSEYTARYGFGVTTQRWPQSVVGPELVGSPDASDQVPDVTDRSVSDPNAEYVAGLTEQEQAAYNAALYGSGPEYEWDATLSDDENSQRAEAFYADLEPSGCFAKAEAQSEFAKITEFYNEFGTEVFEIYETIEADPRLIAKKTEVENCVIEKGLEFVDPDRAYERWDADLADIETNHITGELDSDTSTDTDIVIDDEGKAKLAVLQAEEIAIAIASDECGGGADEMTVIYRELQAEYEQKFLDDNADRISSYASEGDS